jgi:branched-subunit amino acid transport protein
VHAEVWFPWVLIAGLSAIAFLSRALFILPDRQLKLPPALEGVLRYAPAAALTAIIVPDFACLDGVMTLSVANPRLLAGVVAFVVAAWTRSILLTIVFGMAALVMARHWLG